jgi:hypothetical protein
VYALRLTFVINDLKRGAFAWRRADGLKVTLRDYAVFEEDLSFCVVCYFLVVSYYYDCSFGFFVEFLN